MATAFTEIHEGQCEIDLDACNGKIEAVKSVARHYARLADHERRAAREDAETRKWHKYPDETPPNAYGFGGDSRYLVWTETGDGMAYIGLRSYRLDVSKDADPGCWDWYSGSQKESGKVTHWQSLPQRPAALDAARKDAK